MSLSTRLPTALTGLPAYALNLARRTDRWEALVRHMRHAGLPAPQRWPAVDGRATSTDEELAGYERGAPCSRGVLAACLGTNKGFTALVTHVQEQGHPWALLMEDDAQFHPDVHRRYEEFAGAVPADAELILLGGVHKAAPAPVDTERRVWRVKRATCTTAFLVSAAVCPRLLAANTPRRTSFDVAWQAVQADGRTYCPSPHLAVQRADYSDIGGRVARRSYRQYGPEAGNVPDPWTEQEVTGR